MKKFLFLAVLVSAFFTACGGDSGSKGSDPEDGVGRDSTDQGGDKKPLPDIPALAMDSVDTEDDLPACVSSNDGDSAYVKSVYSIYRCDDGLWEPDGFVLQRVKSKDKLPECIKDRISMLVVTTDSSMVYRCGRESWTALGKMIVSESDLPNCTEKRNGEMAYVQETGKVLVCDGRWMEQEFDDAVYCGTRSYDPAEKFCIAEKLYALCGGKDFDPAKQFCSEDSLYALCGGEDYRPTRRFCVRDTLYDMCDRADFDPTKKFCAKDKLYDLCGGRVYDVDKERCESGKVLGICGTETYDASEKFCVSGELYDLCGGKKYDIAAEFCSGNQVYSMCGGSSYDVTAKFCSDNQTYDLCDGEKYDMTEKFCSDSKIYDLCDGKEYDVTVKFCVDNQTYDLCDGKEYDVETESCVSGKIYGVCGMILYDKSLKFCSGSQLYDLCGGLEYDVEEASCVDGEVKSCNTLTYDKTTHFCDKRNARVYRFVTIGTQTWMAENLNYSDSTNYPSMKGRNWCYENKLDSCTKYGRLYTWAAAIDSMKLANDATNPLTCGYGVECGLSGKVQGICPDGWHLPTHAEWQTLFTAVGGSSTAGSKLKSQTGWKAYSGITNEDAYSFSALPAGYYHGGAFFIVGNYVSFWSSTEYSRDGAYGMSLLYDDDNGYLYNRGKIAGFSVRCLRD